MAKPRKTESETPPVTSGRALVKYLAVPVALWEQLKEIADADERSMSWAARRAVAEYVERHKLPPGE